MCYRDKQASIRASYLRNVILAAYDGKYDEVYTMHGDFPQKPDLVGKLIEGAQEILSGKAEGTEVDMFGNKVTLYRFPYAGFLYRG